MRKTFKLSDLECASCAAKMEAAIRKVDGVIDARVNFMAQKLTLEAADGQFDRVLAQARKIVADIEPDAAIVS